MAKISVRIKGHGRKKHNDRLMKCVSRLDRNIKCWIVDCTLRTLHPVNDDLTASVRTTIASYQNALAGLESC